MLSDITPLVLTYNEAPNIRRTLEKLAWAREILVLDSFSTDETIDIVKSFPQARVVQRKFDSFAQQCNFGLQQVKTDWVLSLDADYVLSDELNRELADLKPTPEITGYRASFTYCIHGQELRASLYPPRTVLYRKHIASYRDEGHSHRVQVTGQVQQLTGKILHDDRKPLERWLSEQVRYAAAEAKHLLRDHGRQDNGTTRPKDAGQWAVGSSQQPEVSSPTSDLRPLTFDLRSPNSKLQTPGSKLSWPDRVRKWVVIAPVAIFFYTLFGKGLILDGWPGWYYVFQRTLAEILLSLRLIEQKMIR